MDIYLQVLFYKYYHVYLILILFEMVVVQSIIHYSHNKYISDLLYTIIPIQIQ